MRGLDYSAGAIRPATVITKAGFGFVLRYTDAPNNWGRKHIRPDEYRELTAAGIPVYLIMEVGTDDMLGGHERGVAYGQRALAGAEALGHTGLIFACCDRHITAAQIPTALAYIDGFSSVVTRERTGVYGFYELIDAAIPAGKGSAWWQCGIRPDTRTAPDNAVNLWQRNDGQTTVAGIQCDINEVLVPLPAAGASPPAPVAAPPPPPPPNNPLDGITPAFDHYDVRALGWPVGDPSVLVPFSYRGVPFPAGVHRDTVPIWTALLDRLTAVGVVLSNPGCWGYNNRAIRNGAAPSFHSAGLALDVNAPTNPYSKNGVALAHSLPDDSGAIARSLGMEWGGDWKSPKDYMHFELHLNPDQARIVAGRLSAHAATPAPDPTHVEDPMLPVLNYGDGYQGDPRGGVHWYVMSLQALLNVRGLSVQVATTGEFDKDTARMVRELQETRGLTPSGTVDAATWAAALGNDAPDYLPH